YRETGLTHRVGVVATHAPVVRVDYARPLTSGRTANVAAEEHAEQPGVRGATPGDPQWAVGTGDTRERAPAVRGVRPVGHPGEAGADGLRARGFPGAAPAPGILRARSRPRGHAGAVRAARGAGRHRRPPRGRVRRPRGVGREAARAAGGPDRAGGRP